jgi:hypothetical protein
VFSAISEKGAAPMTDEFRPVRLDCDRTIVAAAMRMARQISRTLGARRSRLSDDAERAAVLREAFEGVAAGVLPDESGGGEVQA